MLPELPGILQLFFHNTAHQRKVRLEAGGKGEHQDLAPHELDQLDESSDYDEEWTSDEEDDEDDSESQKAAVANKPTDSSLPAMA